jgi:hypothetical protein
VKDRLPATRKLLNNRPINYGKDRRVFLAGLLSQMPFGNQTISCKEIHGFASLPRDRFAISFATRVQKCAIWY